MAKTNLLGKKKEDNTEKVEQELKRRIIRKKTIKEMIAPTGIDASSLDHIEIISTTDRFARSFFVANLPRMCTFPELFRDMYMFGDINTSVYINPILESMESLLEQSQVNVLQGRTILAKKRQLEDWKNVFYRDGKKRIKSLITQIKSVLNGEIASFAEDHFDDKNADKAWDKMLKSQMIEKRCQELLEDLEVKSNDKLKEVFREITNELNFATAFEGDKSIRMHKIIDDKRLWKWSSISIGDIYRVSNKFHWIHFA